MKYSRKLKTSVLTIVLTAAFVFNAIAQQEAVKLTPFTGMDFVRIVVDDTFKQNPANTFKAAIRSTKDNSVLWQGDVDLIPVDDKGKKTLSYTISGLEPQLWSPSSPYLYEITLEQYNNRKRVNALTERLGFRSFESKGGNLFLNGQPIFLRGFAINPPNRGIPTHVERSREFAMQYVRFMKSLHVNIIRIPDDETWYDVCDELGMMVFGGNYSGTVARGAKVENFEKIGDETDGGFPQDYDMGVAWYKHNKLGAIAHHPSLMIYAMTNETPFADRRAAEWEKFLSYAYDELKQWDETRVYIANAGYGYGKVGDICDLHRYWGWYYSSPFTFLHTRDNNQIVPFPKKVQPITFTECIGNYTGPDGRYNMTPNHKNPGSQLAWTGHARQDIQANLADEHQIYTIKQAVEIFRRLRVINHELSGIFPFTILFYNWDTVNEFADMNPKPAADQLKRSFQPILLSWECWTPQVYAGSSVKTVAHVVNDDNEGQDLKNATIVYQLLDKTHEKLWTDSVKIPDVAYYATYQQPIDITIPDHIATGEYELTGVIISGDKVVSKNSFKLFVANEMFVKSAAPSPQSEVLLYDPTGMTAKSLRTLGITYEKLTDFKNIPLSSSLIIGENAADHVIKQNSAHIKDYMAKGGRVLCLRQDSLHLPNVNAIVDRPFQSALPDIDNPAYPAPIRPSRNGYYVNAERQDHPTMSGIHRRHLRVWSDYTNWEVEKDGLPAIYPVTDGFMPADKASLSQIAVLCNYGAGLEGVALAEQFNGKGSLLLSGFDLVRRTGVDPIADRLLLNLIAYNATDEGHEPHPLITHTIVWGDYETEKGILTGVNSGLMVNSTPRIPETAENKTITITEKGDQFAPGLRVAFASRPGLQYVANGRRPFGPYYLRGFAAMPEVLDKKSVEGEGRFWCRVLPGVNTAISKVWNPDSVPLTIHIQVNGESVSKEIQPHSTEEVSCIVKGTDIQMGFKGDRRLVILETAFIHKK